MPDDPGIKVDDEEGIVDKKVKNHITDLRRQIDADERRLYVELPSERSDFGRREANLYWTTSVRQYLRAIKRLWAGEEDKSSVDNVNLYWETRKIAQIPLVPPPTDGIDLRPYYDGQLTRQQLIRKHDLPRDVDIPEPETKVFSGLQSVLETEAIQKQWTMKTNDGHSPSDVEYVTFRIEQPLPKEVLESAVEYADNFLQQAGVGFQTKAEPYMANKEEPGL